MKSLNTTKNKNIYLTIKELSKKYSVKKLCIIAKVQRSSYYKWLNRKESVNEVFNQKLLKLIEKNYEESGAILGYRQMTIKLNRENDFKINEKRVLRLMRIKNLKSVCRKKRKNYIKCKPEITAENVLNREFKSNKFGEKWLTDVTEMKYGTTKVYLSAILDLSDKSIVAYNIARSNNNDLVFKNFDIAREKFPNVKPIFHSDRGIQYTSVLFRKKLNDAGMTQSMSRISRCIDNGPMEAFWGTLKSEMYYLKTFKTYDELVTAIKQYIEYYNTKRYQKRLCCMTPIEFRNYLNSKSLN
ncbi:MAG: IS3 family transposase [Bacilli bacterium]